MNKVIGLQEIRADDFKRILECFNCRYFERCDQEVEEPVEDENGQCRTKKIFMAERNRECLSN